MEEEFVEEVDPVCQIASVFPEICLLRAVVPTDLSLGIIEFPLNLSEVFV